MVYMFSFDKHVLELLLTLNGPIWIKIMSYVNILNAFWLDVKFARYFLGSGKLTVTNSFARWVVTANMACALIGQLFL